MFKSLAMFALVLTAALSPARARSWVPLTYRDVFFVLDGSGSISNSVWIAERDLVKEIILNDIPRLGTHRVGVIVFSRYVATIVPLTYVTTQNASTLADAVGAAAKPGDSSYMKDAMKSVFDQYKAATPYWLPKLAVLITDGVPTSNEQAPCTMKSLLDSWSVDTYVVGLGSPFVNTKVKCLVNDAAIQLKSWAVPGDEAEDFIVSAFLSCPADLSKDGMVDDADFTSFLVSYDALLVPPADPLADFNRDGMVDDADFVIFLNYYDELICPGRLSN